jgi:hypothetical protein
MQPYRSISYLFYVILSFLGFDRWTRAAVAVAVQTAARDCRFCHMADTLDPQRKNMASAFVTAAGETAREDDERQIRQLQVEFALVPGTTGDQFQKDFPAYADGLVGSSPGGYVALSEYPKKAETVYNLKPRADDVYVLTFPKCGNYIIRQIVFTFLRFFKIK